MDSFDEIDNNAIIPQTPQNSPIHERKTKQSVKNRVATPRIKPPMVKSSRVSAHKREISSQSNINNANDTNNINNIINNPTKTTLIIDDREKAITVHSFELSTISHKIMRIEHGGDYVVTRIDGEGKTVIIAIIERKSLNDFAASIRDGRKANIQHLLRFREQTGCRILYLIEGNLDPRPTDTFENYSWASIESAIFHLIVRDGICVLRTRDTLATAQQLARFVKSMDTLAQNNGNCIDMEITEQLPITSFGGQELTALLKERHVKSNHDIVREMWGKIGGISIDSADNYIKSWTLCDIILERIPRETLHSHKFGSGRGIPKRAIESLKTIDNSTARGILSVVPGVSVKAAAYILNHISLRELVAKSKAELLAISVTDKKKINNAIADNILFLFNYKMAE